MKKIFAFALALVVVLSMASAFAITNCEIGTFGWDCPVETTNCGKAVVEVVPYVKANAACDSWEYVVSDCAAAIKSEKVYYAIKLTVEANPNEDWFKAAKVVVEEKGLNEVASLNASYKVNKAAGIDLTSDEVEVYYLDVASKKWANEDATDFNIKNYVIKTAVKDADKAEVCATLYSYDDGIGEYVWGDYTIDTTGLTVTDGVVSGWMYITGDYGKVGYNVVAGEVLVVNGDKKAVEDANATFGLGCGWVCVTPDALVANFGWDFEQEDCFDWSEKGASVVDTDCVVAIPKTGDASVLAWLF